MINYLKHFFFLLTSNFLFLDDANLILTSNQIKVRDIAKDWTSFEEYLLKNSSLTDNQVEELSQQIFSMDVLTIMWLKSNKFEDFSCNATTVERYLKLNSNPMPIDVSLETIADNLCSSPDVLAILLQNLKMEDILDLVSVSYDLNPENLVTASNLTVEEFETAQQIWSDFSKIFDDLEKSVNLLLEDLDLEAAKEQLNITKIDRDAMIKLFNHFTCGEPLRPDETKYKPLEPITNDTSSGGDEPTDACNMIYEQISDTWAGKAVWRYMHPFLSGYVYLTPINDVTEGIKSKSEWFFNVIEEFRSKVHGITKNHEFYAYPKYYQSQFETLTILMYSNFFIDFKASMVGEKYKISDLMPVNLTVGLNTLNENKDAIEMINKLSISLDCINTKRFKLIESEHALLEAAKENRETFLAGVVILNSTTSGANKERKREVLSLPKNIQYKVRMEVDSVPISSQIKERLWVPGPDGDFFYNMRYFWGFLQVQDFVDNAIIELQTGEKPSDEVLMQQFPYPCFLRSNYLSGLYTAQMVQVVLIFGYAAVVSMFVRDYVWERESKNGQIMQVMGMKSYIMWISNVIVMFGILILNSLLLSLLMKFGQILPKTNFEIVFITLLAYSTSLVAFVYLLSVSIKKATAGSVVTFLMFILAFLPFLILVSLDEEISDIVKVLSALFMNSSFGFCFLYITRFEQQQVGMSWETIGTSPIDDDSFTCMHYLIFLILDTFIYGIIGLIISKLSNIDGSWTSSKSERVTDIKSEISSESTTNGIS